MANLTVYIAKGYDLSGGTTNFTSDDLFGYSDYFLEFIWSNVTGTLDGELLIRETSDDALYDSIKTFTVDTADKTRYENNIGLVKDKIDVKFTPNGITGGRLSIKLRAIENNLQEHNTNKDSHEEIIRRFT